MRLEADIACKLAPLLDVTAEDLTEILRWFRMNFESERGQLVAHFRHRERPVDLTVEPRNDFTRGTGGSDDAEPATRLKSRQGFGDRRQIGIVRCARRSPDTEQPQPAGKDMGLYIDERSEHRIDAAAHDLRDDRLHALVGNVQVREATVQAEELG